MTRIFYGLRELKLLVDLLVHYALLGEIRYELEQLWDELCHCVLHIKLQTVDVFEDRERIFVVLGLNEDVMFVLVKLEHLGKIRML